VTFERPFLRAIIDQCEWLLVLDARGQSSRKRCHWKCNWTRAATSCWHASSLRCFPLFPQFSQQACRHLPMLDISEGRKCGAEDCQLTLFLASSLLICYFSCLFCSLSYTHSSRLTEVHTALPLCARVAREATGRQRTLPSAFLRPEARERNK